MRPARDVAHERMRRWGACTRNDEDADRLHSDECDDETTWVTKQREAGASWFNGKALAVAAKSGSIELFGAMDDLETVVAERPVNDRSDATEHAEAFLKRWNATRSKELYPTSGPSYVDRPGKTLTDDADSDASRKDE
jgi:hypothetical protein